MEIKDNNIREGIVTYVVDGDTMDFQADLGFETMRKVRIRIEAINTAEMKDQTEYGSTMAKRAKAYAIDKTLNKKVRIHSEGKDSYGRYLGTVYYRDGDQWVDLGQDMIDRGLAHQYVRGASKRPYTK